MAPANAAGARIPRQSDQLDVEAMSKGCPADTRQSCPHRTFDCREHQSGGDAEHDAHRHQQADGNPHRGRHFHRVIGGLRARPAQESDADRLHEGNHGEPGGQSHGRHGQRYGDVAGGVPRGGAVQQALEQEPLTDEAVQGWQRA